MPTKIKPIDKRFKPLIENFLASPDFQDNFVEEAKKLGYNGTDPDKIKVALFTPAPDGQICFANNEVYELFILFQVLEQLYKVGIATPDMDEGTKAQLVFECREILDDLLADPE